MSRVIVSFVISFLAFSSCNITYKVRDQYQELEQFLYFPCGKVGFELIGRGNSKFIFRQNFILNKHVTVFPDSMKFFLNDKPISVGSNKGDGFDVLKVIEIEGNKKNEIYFETEEGVFDGDTIAVFAERYLNCDGEFIGFDTIYYTFLNRVRIHGVNAL